MGHAFVSVETSGQTLRRNRRQKLQWGHAFVSVETQMNARPWTHTPRLQWGHAFVSVETAHRADRARVPNYRFNGATLL